MKIAATLLICVALTGSHPHAQRGTPAAPPTQTEPATASTSPAPAPVVSDTFAAQVMLDRLGFSSGEIDGRPGANVKGALSAFQQAQGRTPSGTLDDATWQALREGAGNVPPLVMYAITEADLAGPFSPSIPSDLEAQAKLDALRYRDPLEQLAEKFHVSPALLKDVNPAMTLKAAGEQILVPNVSPMEVPAADAADANARTGSRQTGAAAPPQPKVTIYVTKSTSALTVEDESKHVLFHAPVTSGSEHDPLPIGNWKITGVQRNPVFNYNPQLFWDADPKHSKARIPAGPNNPVGVIWIDLSKPHYGIHGTPEPSKIGHVESHGCVRLTNWDVVRVAQWTRPGTPVVFRE
jgi:lipoprotein-anchoring transpeptidase ErfK/SrfK